MGGDGDRQALLLAPAYDHGVYLGAESLGIRSVASALLGEGARVTVLDECPQLPPPEVLDAAGRSSLIGIGALFTRQIPDVLALALRLRAVSPGAHITVGGQGTHALWPRMLDECEALDSACLNEAEVTVGELWRHLVAGTGPEEVRGMYLRRGGELRFTGPRPPVEDLDALPVPYRRAHRTAYADGHITVCTSRGCAAHCTFCQSGNYANRHRGAPRWRYRSAAHVVEEIAGLRERYGARMFSIVDDDFLGGDRRGVQRAHDFASLVTQRGLDIRFSIECRISELDAELLTALREAGLRHVLIGVESANEADIKLYAKRTTARQAADAIALLRRTGIEFSVGFIMFQPLSDLAGIRTNLDFLRRNNVGSYRRIVNRLEVYPGSPLAGYFRRKQVEFREDAYRMYYDFADPRVALLREAFVGILKPFAELENRVDRALFRLRAEEGPHEGPHEGPAQDTPSVRDRLGRLTRVADSVTRALLDGAYRCLQMVEDGGSPLADERLVAGTAARVEGLGEKLAA